MTGVGSSPALATFETSQVLLAGVSGVFPGVLLFRPTYRLARLDMSDSLARDIKLNQKKEKSQITCSFANSDTVKFLNFGMPEIFAVIYPKS